MDVARSFSFSVRRLRMGPELEGRFKGTDIYRLKLRRRDEGAQGGADGVGDSLQGGVPKKVGTSREALLGSWHSEL